MFSARIPSIRRQGIALVQKVGYLCTAAHLVLPESLRARLRKQIKPSSRTYLVPRVRGGSEPRFKSSYDREWGVVVNLDPGLLFKV